MSDQPHDQVSDLKYEINPCKMFNFQYAALIILAVIKIHVNDLEEEVHAHVDISESS